jgi:hypothetical protein
LAVLVLVWLTGCAPNEPFDPDSVANIPPVVKMSVSSFEGDGLNPTSYFNRKFSWYGSDQDGWVQEYYVSIRNVAAIPAAWDTTTQTDTTMTFTTDGQGDAEATFLIVCRDDRGALSDTLVQFVPLRNFPPAVNFQSDFDPLRNMQREITLSGTSPADTLYWNWGVANFRFFALDLDGSETMDAFYRYTLANIEPTETFDEGDPQADPLTTWVRVPFASDSQIRDFQIFVSGLPAGPRSITVSVIDAAEADTRFSYSWEVREPKSNILYVKDNSSSLGRILYTALMDDRFGSDNWDLYDFWFGFPDNSFVLLETMRLFDAVIWTDGGVTSENLAIAAARDGALQSYVYPTDSSTPGRLLFVSKVMAGSTTGLPPTFIQGVLGVSPTGEPAPALQLPTGKQALGQLGGLLPMTTSSSRARGIGLKLFEGAGAEVLYRMEECPRCYGSPRPPFDPVVGVRRPERAVSPLAVVVSFSVQLEYFDQAEVIDALTVILTDEMGVSAP